VTSPQKIEDITSQLAGTTFPDAQAVPLWKRALDISIVLIAIPTLLPTVLIIIAMI
jgi:hypothetical protein